MNCYNEPCMNRPGNVPPQSFEPRPWYGAPVPMPSANEIPQADLSRFPIGMGYVPMQTWQQLYSLERGFRRGTIFPELDLPFMMGRCR